MTLTFKNSIGSVTFYGQRVQNAPFVIREITGLMPPDVEQTAVTYAGEHGQETTNIRYLPRSITVGLDIISNIEFGEISQMVNTLSHGGELHIKHPSRAVRITVNSVTFSDLSAVLKGKIASLSVQFNCDDPFFYDSETIYAPIYATTKDFILPTSLPSVLGRSVLGANIEILGFFDVQPVIRILFSEGFDTSSEIKITNTRIGKSITLTHTPKKGEEINIDTKNRTAVSSISGDIISGLSADTFLSDFVLKPGSNQITINTGLQAEFATLECVYSNKYLEGAV